ncbi:MAG: AAA family ATPase [Pyrinomonadaceae bacterium]
MESEVLDATEDVAMPRKMNEVIEDALKQRPRPELFDGFWQTGELALLFGAAGIGKSLLAVQLADVLARGRPFYGFNMPRRRHKVLYVDLVLSDTQFQRRYTDTDEDTHAPRPYRFAERIHRDRPGYDEDLCAWVRKMVNLHGFEVVVIDDLSAVMRTDDGTFDTLRIMREMKRLSHEKDISILMLADSMESPANRDISEADLRRSRVLCGVADSVFAIGRWGRGQLKLQQFRAQGSAVKWGHLNPIGCFIKKDTDGLLGFGFDERFTPKLDPERSELICRINKEWGAGKSFGLIADEMNISRSMAYRLFRAWTPAMYRLVYGREANGETDRYGYDERTDIEPIWDEEDEFEYESESEIEPVEELPEPVRFDPSKIPFAAGLGRRSMYDLELEYDKLGKDLYVESRYEPGGKRRVWYTLNSKNFTVRNIHNGYGTIGERVGKAGWINSG